MDQDQDQDQEQNQEFVTPEDLQQAQDQKRKLAFLGGLGDSLSNMQSAGNFKLGKMAPHVSVTSALAPQMDQADQTIKNKQTLLAQELQKPQVEQVKALLDPSSPETESRRQLAKASVDALRQAGVIKDEDSANALKDRFDNMHGFAIQRQIETDPLLKKGGELAMSKNKLDATVAGLGIRREGLDVRKDNQAADAAGAFDKDPVLQSTQRQLNQIAVDSHTLSTAKIITPQMVHEIGAGIASALNQGKAVGLGQMEMQDMATSQTKLASLEQMLLNEPRNGASPEIKQQMLDTLDRLRASYQKAQASRAAQVSTGREYAHNPAAQKAVHEKVKQYGDTSPENEAVAGGGQSDMVQVISPEGLHGTLPRANVEKAKQRGFKIVGQ